MPDSVHVMIQMRQTAAMAVASFGPISAAPHVMGITDLPGVQFDASFSPVPIPPRSITGAKFLMAEESSASTYIVRATVNIEALEKFIGRANESSGVVGVFSDPHIQPISVCPNGPVGTDLDVEKLLLTDELKKRGMTGAGVRVVIVDTGFNMTYLQAHGKSPTFDPSLSWGPFASQPLGQMPIDHGTMCAYDVCIAAPACSLVDHAVLTSQSPGSSVMEGLLSDAVKSYGMLLSYMSKAPSDFAGDHIPRTLVVSNSWGMFHPSWDFPVGDAQNYSDNPAHPFNIIVGSLEEAGADILFAAGNCGTECPDNRCQGVTNAGIFGANSSQAVTSVAGVVISKDRIGYSTKGPGRLEQKKPDIASFTHFAGSGVYAADGGTSAATPVAAGVVAAIRRSFPASVLSPDDLRQLIRRSAEPRGSGTFNYEYGYGVINVKGILNELDAL
jgi:subtilisin family serine protease